MKLTGGLPGTATFLYSGPDGSLIVELYDHSEKAERSFGSDVAFLLHIAAEDKARILALLQANAERSYNSGAPGIFKLMRERFQDYYAVKDWLDANGIAYRKEFDSHA
ncbi:MAG TPA: hypothetical protein VKF40_23600 [Burkholderiales bacterium]|nr:hypothetical protein [Burkholderiales bacterium]